MKRKVLFIFILACWLLFFVSGAGAEEATPATPATPEKTGNEPEKEDLLNRIEELEKRINEMTEETRARRKLEITEQEKQEKEKEVLEAVGREYTMDPRHTLGVDYSVSYSYTPSERYTGQPLLVEKDIDHTIEHTISTSYSILDNMSASTSIPFVYRYDQMGTTDEMDETDIGDISFGVTVQPQRTGAGDVNTTVSFSASLPTGRSPYEINPDKELSTGSGLYGFSLTGNFSKQIDPVVAFWSLGYSYKLTEDGLNFIPSEGYILEKVDPGDSVFFAAGLGYALSYKVSVNASFSYSYYFSNDYYYMGAPAPVESGDSASGTVTFGLGWKVSRKTTLSFSLGYGLTGSGFSLTFRAPFSFML